MSFFQDIYHFPKTVLTLKFNFWPLTLYSFVFSIPATLNFSILSITGITLLKVLICIVSMIHIKGTIAADILRKFVQIE